MIRFSSFARPTFLAACGLLSISLTAPVFAQGNTAPATTSWLTFKGDLQRTSASDAKVTFPLNLLWRHSTDAQPGRNITSPLVVGPVGSRRVYFAAGNAVFCVNAATGEQIWRSAPLQGGVTAPIALLSDTEEGDLILVVTSGGRLSALRSGDGAQAWEASAGAAIQNAAPVLISTPRGQRIMISLSTSKLIAFAPDGALDTAWSVQLGSIGATPSTTPAVSPDGKLLFVPTSDQRFFVVDVQKGAVSFQVRLPQSSFSAPCIAGNRIILTTGDEVGAYSDRTGTPVWRTKLDGRAIASPAARADNTGGGRVYAGSTRGTFYALDARKGAIDWKVSLGSSVTGIPVALPNAIAVGTNNGELFALNPEDGAILWRYRLQSEALVDVSEQPAGGNAGGGEFAPTRFVPTQFEGQAPAPGTPTNTEVRLFGVSSPPSIVDGQMFLQADNAALYAFDITPFDPAPPLAEEPTLSVLNTARRYKGYLIDPKNPPLVPGRPPIVFSVSLTDAGSGVDVDSVRVTIDGKPIAKESIAYRSAEGVLDALLVDTPKLGQRPMTLQDGSHTVALQARDYRGNALEYSGTFLVDNKLPAPPAEDPVAAPAQGLGEGVPMM